MLLMLQVAQRRRVDLILDAAADRAQRETGER
jgi:hypothetical protein